jgi:putative inorganic carbon (HCO3(-)) transporter
MKTLRASAPSRAAFGLLTLGLLLITPLAFARGFPDQFTYIKLLLTKGLVLAGVVAFALSFIWGRHRWPRDSRLGPPLALLVLVVLLSCLASPLPAFGLLEAESFLCGPLWLGVLIGWGGGETWVRRMAALIAIAGTGAAVIVLLQWAGHDPLLFGGYHIAWGHMRAVMRLYSTFGNPNLVAGYLIGVIFLLLALAAASKTLTGRILSVAAILVIFAAILGTRSRGAWLGLAAGLLVARRFWARRSEDVAPAPAGSPTGGTLACLAPAGMLMMLSSLAPLAWALISRLQGRACMWRAAWPMFTEHPLLGGGWGMFQLRFLELQAEFLASHPQCVRYWTHARQLHNDPLQILLEAGAVGLVALGWLLWAYGREARKLLPCASRPERLWLAASVGGVTAILVDSLFNYQLSVPPTLILLFTLLAVPQMLKAPEFSPPAARVAPKARAVLRGLFCLTLVGAALFLALGIVRQARAEHSLALGLEQEGRGNRAAAEQFFRAGLTLAPDDARLHYGLARALYVQEQYPAALAEVLKAERNLADSHLEVLRARIQDQMGFRLPALAAYRHALWLDPTLRSVRADIERLSR